MRERFELDTFHTILGFSARHLGVSTVRGQFREFSGWFEADRNDLASATGEVTIQVGSIDTNTGQRDDHLRSSDFFDAVTYPTMTFRLTGVRPVDGESFDVDGEITIRETTRPIALRATLDGETPNPMGAGSRLGVSVTAQLDRKDFGLNWDGLAGTIPMVSNAIKLQIDAELVASPAGVPEAARAR